MSPLITEQQMMDLNKLFLADLDSKHSCCYIVLRGGQEQKMLSNGFKSTADLHVCEGARTSAAVN